MQNWRRPSFSWYKPSGGSSTVQQKDVRGWRSTRFYANSGLTDFGAACGLGALQRYDFLSFPALRGSEFGRKGGREKGRTAWD